ncbi:hypothetical protein ABLI39_17160, partial [Pseudarthrobacter sp. B907]|uniref:hypothetical protein n=1 Tax=Pseudarthrobacter sp. B907 TaxID=3158261 RepID=UPI0032DBCB7C
MTAVTLCPRPWPGAWGGKSGGYNMFAALGAVVVLLFSYWFLCNVSSGDGFVVWEPHSGRKQS